MKKRRLPGKRRSSAGFTLIEMIVAAVVGGIVLMGTFSLMTTMVSTEVNSMRDGTVTAWSLAGINAMSADIAGAGAVAYPSPGSSDNALVICTNWSTLKAGASPPPAGAVVAGKGNTVYTYCYDTTDAPPSPFANAILRLKTVNASGSEACPAGPLPACTSGGYGQDSIVATGVYRWDAATTNIKPIFTNAASAANSSAMSAVHFQLYVGNPAGGSSAGGNPNTNTPTAVPVTVPYDKEIVLED